jgi:hypothetical protein
MIKNLILIFAVLFFVSCNNNTTYNATFPNGVDSAALKMLDPKKGIYPEIWGAVGDGKRDNTWALNECSKYIAGLKGVRNVTIYLSGIYRITDTWTIGTKFVDLEYAFQYINFNTPTFSQVDYNLSRYKTNVSIVGTVGSGIYADFDDSTKLKPAILYTLQGDTRAGQSIELYNTVFSNFGVYAKGYLQNGVPTRIASYQNNVCGIACLSNTGIKISGCAIIGFKEGIIQNYSYFSKIENTSIDKCERGIFSYGSASSKLELVRFSNDKKAMELRSSAVELSTIYTTQCPISIHVGAGGITGTNLYFESYNTGAAQIIIGDDPLDKYYLAGRNGIVDGTAFTNAIVVANKADGSGGNSILMKETARKFIIFGGSLQSSNKVSTNPLNEIITLGTLGTFPAPLCKKIQYQ